MAFNPFLSSSGKNYRNDTIFWMNEAINSLEDAINILREKEGDHGINGIGSSIYVLRLEKEVANLRAGVRALKLVP